MIGNNQPEHQPMSRIQQAASGLNERISELQLQQAELNLLDAKLTELTDHLLSAPEDSPAENALA